MAPTSKQADRKAAKQASKTVDDEPATAEEGFGAIISVCKELVFKSVLVKLSPALPDLLKEKSDAGAAEVKKDATSNEQENEGDENKENVSDEDKKPEEPADAASIFEGLRSRLPFYNPLGLGLPASGEASKIAWLSLKSLEVDGGPRARKKGTPGMDRIKVNVEKNLPQYIHIVLLLMCLRAFLFRSWFACLPWLVGYQVLSLEIPLGLIREKFPQVPPVDSKFRIAATLAIHGLMWLFFLYEALSLVTVLLIGLVIVHAYVASPLLN